MKDPADDSRFPRWVYGQGSEPDPRFTLANERTFLAWIRTAVALLAAGVAIAAFAGNTVGQSWQSHTAALVLIGLGVISGVSSYIRWMRHERAMRRAEALPSSGIMPLFAVVVIIVAVLGVSLVF